MSSSLACVALVSAGRGYSSSRRGKSSAGNDKLLLLLKKRQSTSAAAGSTPSKDAESADMSNLALEREQEDLYFSETASGDGPEAQANQELRIMNEYLELSPESGASTMQSISSGYDDRENSNADDSAEIEEVGAQEKGVEGEEEEEVFFLESENGSADEQFSGDADKNVSEFPDDANGSDNGNSDKDSALVDVLIEELDLLEEEEAQFNPDMNASSNSNASTDGAASAKSHGAGATGKRRPLAAGEGARFRFFRHSDAPNGSQGGSGNGGQPGAAAETAFTAENEEIQEAEREVLGVTLDK